MKSKRPILRTFPILLIFFALLTSDGVFGQKRNKTPRQAESRAVVLVDEADKLSDERKWPEALDAYKLAIRIDPNYAPAHGGLGYAYLNAGNPEPAHVAFKEQVRLAPNDAEAQFDLGYYYNFMGRHGEAFAPLVRATALKPTFAEAFYEIGYAYLRGTDFEKSVPFFKSAIRLKPDYAEAIYGLGQVYTQLGDAALASQQLRKLGPLDPKLASKLEKEIPVKIAAETVKPVAKPIEPENQPIPGEIAKPPAPVIQENSTSTVAEAGQTAEQDQTRQLVQPSVEKANGKRIALVIGNSLYATAPQLRNPQNDARDMAAMLKSLGFEVISSLNVNQREMKRLIREFGLKLKSGGAGLFYYAGHGVQSKGRNYLIPIDAEIQSEPEIEDFGVDVNLVLNFMDDAQNGLNIVILDACRDNPFGRSFRSASNGLAQVDAPTGTLIAYATAPGRVASDGSGRNGLYTDELLRQMPLPGVSATEMFMRVRAAVVKTTGSKQVPWEASSLIGTFYFSGSPAKVSNARLDVPVVETKVDSSTFELTYWDSIKNSTDPEEFKAYLEKYPHGHFVELANNKLRQLATARDKSSAATPIDAKSPTPDAPSDKMRDIKTFDVKNGVRRTPGILEVSTAGLNFREVGGRNDFNVPCSALQVVSINTSWASTVFHKLHIKFSFNGEEKQVDLDGKNNKQIRDLIMETCAMKKK